MDNDATKKTLLEEYTELTRNSLVKVQFSCGGNSTSIDEPEPIPIVPESYIPDSLISYAMAREEDVEAIVALLNANNLLVKDLGKGKRIFQVALSDEKTIGCVAVEMYETVGLLRSLAVEKSFRGKGIGQKLVVQAETWSYENGIKNLYLLTTTAADFFPKIGWSNTERGLVPENIASSSEFSSVCPSTAICMTKKLE